MFGIAKFDLNSREFQFSPIGPTPDGMMGLEVSPDRKSAYTVVLNGEQGMRKCEFWAFDLANRRTMTSEFPCRPRFSFGMSSTGKELYIYGAGFEIEVYDAATLKLKRVTDLKNDVTWPAWLSSLNMRVDIRGDGVAALTCSYLLQTAGCSTAIQRNTRPLLPALMVSASSQALFCDILNAADALSNLPRIETRVVKWGASETTIALPHSAVVVSEELLQSRIAKLVRFDCGSDDSPDWTILSSWPLPDLPMEHTFGQRMATVVPVKLQSRSAPRGWLPASNVTCRFAVNSTDPAGLDAGGRPPRSRFTKVWVGATAN